MERMCRDKMIHLITEAKRTDPEAGSFTEWLADYLLNNLFMPRQDAEYKIGILLEEAFGLVNNDFPTTDQIAEYLVERGVTVSK